MLRQLAKTGVKIHLPQVNHHLARMFKIHRHTVQPMLDCT